MGMALSAEPMGELALVSRADIAQTKSELKEQFYELGYEQAKRDVVKLIRNIHGALLSPADIDAIGELRATSTK